MPPPIAAPVTAPWIPALSTPSSQAFPSARFCQICSCADCGSSWNNPSLIMPLTIWAPGLPEASSFAAAPFGPASASSAAVWTSPKPGILLAPRPTSPVIAPAGTCRYCPARLSGFSSRICSAFWPAACAPSMP